MKNQLFHFGIPFLMWLSVISISVAQIDISMTPSSDNPVAGDIIEISINIAGGQNVAGYDFRLTFSPTELEFKGIENADYLGGEGRALTFSPTELESVSDPDYPVSDVYTILDVAGDGSVRFAAFTLTGTGKGDGPLAVARFKVLAETETTIGFERVVIGSRTAQEVEIASAIGATITPTAASAGDVEFKLSIPAGISLIHVPLKVNAVDGVARTIESVSDLYDVLGGASTLNFLITYDSQTQGWRSYFGAFDKGGPADVTLSDDKGVIAGLRTSTVVRLRGSALGTDGTSTVTLRQGLNLVGLPLNDSRITRVSDLFALNGIGGNVPVVIHTHGGEFKLVGGAGGPGDIEISGGQAFILTAQRAAMVDISGDAWASLPEASSAPPISLAGIEVDNVTPILALRGSIAGSGRGLSTASFRLTVKNRATGRTVTTVAKGAHHSHTDNWGPDGIGYQLTDVDLERGRAAMIGDILEISAQSSNPLIGVEPFQYTVTAEDVRQGWIQLQPLRTYEVPAETALLHNYPNPFNPETWIPYQLAHAADVTLTIYDAKGVLVRQLDLGYQQAGYYTDRTRAAYWDGRNQLGESVGSGIYFYQLRTDDYSTTRKMVILK